MFEGRKARRLGIIDTGAIGTKRDPVMHGTCKHLLRQGKRQGIYCHWCPDCLFVLPFL